MNAHDADSPLVLYDGHCGFCQRSVQFALRRDHRAALRFASLHSDIGQELMNRHGIDSSRIDTIVLIDRNRAHLRSSAAVRIGLRLRQPWPVIASLGWLIPRPIRNWIYSTIARHRMRILGGPENCPMPDPDWLPRFIDRADPESGPAPAAALTPAQTTAHAEPKAGASTQQRCTSRAEASAATNHRDQSADPPCA